MSKFLILLFVCISIPGQAQTVRFSTLSGEQTGLKALLSAWRAEEIERQGGKLGSWWMWGLRFIDYDTDGDLDIIISQHATPGCTIARNNRVETGEITFTDVGEELLGDKRNCGIAAGKQKVVDLNKDGFPDIVGFYPGTLAKSFLNQNGASFKEIPTQITTNASRSVRTDYSNLNGIEDRNGDTYPDVTDLINDWLWDTAANVWKKVPSSYEKPHNLPAHVLAQVQEAESENRFFFTNYFEYDLDNDDDVDILVSVYSNHNPTKFMYVLTRQSDGSLLDQTEVLGLDGSSYVLLVEDFNGDGRLDLLLGKGNAPGLYLANPDFTYSRFENTPIQETIGTYNISLSDRAWPYDLDSDGDKDLIIGSAYSTRYEVYENDGSGGMTRRYNPSIWGGSAEAYEFGDLDGNGTLDFIIGRGSGANETIEVWLNDSVVPSASGEGGR